MSVAVGDVDSDGIDDVVTTQAYDPEGMAVRLGRPDGSFSPPTEYGGAPGFGYAELADINGDGSLDAVLATTEAIEPGSAAPSIFVHLNNGDGTFGPVTTTSVERSDRRTGHRRLRRRRPPRPGHAGPAVVFGAGDGTFGRERVIRCSDTWVATDADGDGRPDLAYGVGGHLVVMRNGL